MLSPTFRATAVDRYGNVVGGTTGNTPLSSLGSMLAQWDSQQNMALGGAGGGPSSYDPFAFSGNAPTVSGVYGWNFNPAPYNAGPASPAYRPPAPTEGAAGQAGYSFTQMLQNNGAMPSGSGRSSGTTAGGFAANQDLWNAWKSKLMGALANPGMDAQTVQGLVNRASEGITEREKDSGRALRERVAALGGSNSGASAQAQRQLMEGFSGQMANARRDVRTAAETDRLDRLDRNLSTAGSFLSRMQDRDAEQARWQADQDRADERARLNAAAIAGAASAPSPFRAGGFSFDFGTGEGGGANFSDRYGDRLGQQGGMFGGSGLIGDQYGGGLGDPDYSGVNTVSGFWGGNTQGTWLDNSSGSTYSRGAAAAPYAIGGAKPVASLGSERPKGPVAYSNLQKNPFGKKNPWLAA